MKRKKRRTSPPTKIALRNCADRLWSQAVKDHGAHRCCICGNKGTLNSHHLIPRQHERTRYDLRNGLCLCLRCHQFCPHQSPHLNAAGFMHWLDHHSPETFCWLQATIAAGLYRHHDIAKTVPYYVEQIRTLRNAVTSEDFVRIVGTRVSLALESED